MFPALKDAHRLVYLELRAGPATVHELSELLNLPLGFLDTLLRSLRCRGKLSSAYAKGTSPQGHIAVRYCLIGDEED